MSRTRQEHGVAFPDGETVETTDAAAALRLLDRLPASAAHHVTRRVTTEPWTRATEPAFPGRRGYHDPQPDRYLPGSEYPDHGGMAGYSGIDRSTRVIVQAVLLELGLDVSELSDPAAIRGVIADRARVLGRADR